MSESESPPRKKVKIAKKPSKTVDQRYKAEYSHKWPVLTYNLDKGIQIDVIYTDFEKAFDEVPLQRLISKLEAYNLNSTLLLWIQDFLCNRKQRVIVNGTCIHNGTE